MNILFLTILKIDTIDDRGVYPDLMRKFQKEGHNVHIVTPLERRYRKKTALEQNGNVSVLKVNTLNIQKTNLIEKWLATQLINFQYLKGIRKYFSEIDFDIIIYSTPPITFTRLVISARLNSRAITYLLLKDIFPQNAVDLGLIKKGGFLHHYFIRKEKRLYQVSDFIGCMSQANVNYLTKFHPEIDPGKIEINPNSHELFTEDITSQQKEIIRKKYGIPVNKTVFVYGGNLGKPQGIGFILDFLNSQKDRMDIFFLIAGSGTEYKRMRLWFDLNQPVNATLLSELPKHDYNMLLRSCDVGMIFLDRRFTIPNFPSRLLSYLEYRLPVLAATDKNTDLGEVIMENKFGLWSEAGDLNAIDKNMTNLLKDPVLLEKMGQNGFNFFVENYSVDNSYNIIMNHLKDKRKEFLTS
jgi:glycosyltransferase involved in cell wall biosynthesis